jgi:putative PIN family toxin of toxin-antitoxin system
VQRVVVDTNVWVSALLNPAGYPARVLAALRARRFILVVSQAMLDELRDVLLRPRLTRKYGITEADADELSEALNLNRPALYTQGS